MTTQASTRTVVGDHVGRVVTVLQARYLPSVSRARPDSGAAAALARLRRAPVDDLAEGGVFDLVYDDLPERLMSDAGEPTAAESAIHAALVLYAGHQQSRGEPMHVYGRSLGRAARELAIIRGDGALDEAAVTRFQRVATATGRAARLAQLRSFIALLRSHGIPLDYARLARDLYDLDQPDGAARVRLRWGRDLHTRISSEHAAPTPVPTA